MATIGRLRGVPAIDPRNLASPKAKTLPSAPASQYPPPSGVRARATIGAGRGRPAAEPRAAASPKAPTAPSADASQYPRPSADDCMATTGPLMTPTPEPSNAAPQQLNTPPS